MGTNPRLTTSLVTGAVAGAALAVGALLPDPNAVGTVLGIGGNLIVEALEPILSTAGERLSDRWLINDDVRTAMRTAFTKAVKQIHAAYQNTHYYQSSRDGASLDQLFSDLHEAG